MNKPVSQKANFDVTSGAVSKLLELREVYGKKLKFRIFSDDGLQLRVHDKEYLGDWTFNIAGIGISLCRDTLSGDHSLVLDCYATEENSSGFGLMLFVDGQLANELSGDQIIARILSEETEICDAYGEYCYTTFAAPSAVS